MKPAVVTATEISRRYPSGVVVDRVSLTVDRGQIIGVTGPSGSGKSTLLRLLAGMERPDTGELSYGPHPVWPPGSRAARYPRPGYVLPIFQDPHASLDARWPIWRSITEPLTARERPPRGRAELREIAREWLAKVNLAGIDPDARPVRLSGGQCQRVAILRALVAEPALIVADEPTARQDVVTAAAISELLCHAADSGTAIIIVSHDTEWLDGISDRTMRVEHHP